MAADFADAQFVHQLESRIVAAAGQQLVLERLQADPVDIAGCYNLLGSLVDFRIVVLLA